MNYLFFDIECCDGKHICEFGYILTDGELNVLSREVLTIDPEMPFDLNNRPNQKELELYFSYAKYYMSPTFPHFYDRIRELILAPDQLIFGHAIDNDAKFLRIACRRYKLPLIDFRFLDTQKMYSRYTSSDKMISLGDAISSFSIETNEYLHRSDCDAFATLKLIEALSQKLSCPPHLLSESLPYCAGRIENGVIFLEEEQLKWMKVLEELSEGTISKNKSKNLIHTLHRRIEKTEDAATPHISDKKICFDSAFEHRRTRDAVSLMQLITNAGGSYVLQGDLCDIFVNTLDGNSDTNQRLNAALSRKAQGASVQILTLDEFLELLGVSEQQLGNVPLPSTDILTKYIKPAEQPTLKLRDDDAAPTTLGDILKAKGLDISRLSDKSKLKS